MRCLRQTRRSPGADAGHTWWEAWRDGPALARQPGSAESPEVDSPAFSLGEPAARGRTPLRESTRPRVSHQPDSVAPSELPAEKGEALARPYRSEMAELSATIDWVVQADTSAIVAGLEHARYESIIAVGSGGSLSAAQHLARLQRRFNQRVSVALTPYEFRADPVPADAHCWIFSAGGSNVDVVAAVTTANRAEPAAVNAVTMRSKSPLTKMADKEPLMRLHQLAIPSRKDGFLATNSLLAFCSIMTRCYLEMHGAGEEWDRVVEQLNRNIHETGRSWRAASETLSRLQHLVVLYDSDTSLGAFDLESKLTEAGIVGVQLADYRHFAHGRHHWLAKNQNGTGVLAFSSEPHRSICRRTLRLLPDGIPTALIEIPSSSESAQLSSLLAAFYITETLSFARGIDPGQPGVPEFGRRLYGLSLPPSKSRTREEASVDRKISAQPTPRDTEAKLSSRNKATVAHRRFEQGLTATALGGVVLDYDGTVVDTADRFLAPNPDLLAEIVRLLSEGLPLGIATGRGRSAGEALRTAIPETLWSRVTMGYYNGAVLRDLAASEPLGDHGSPSEQLAMLHKELQVQCSEFSVTLRQQQLTVMAEGRLSENGLWERVRAVADHANLPLLRVTRSSHSVDVFEISTTKLNVVDAVATKAAEPSILRIGDRGRWPGNDYELLASPLGLSVDQVNPDLATCWNIAPEGVRGTRATLHYLQSIRVLDALGWYEAEAG